MAKTEGRERILKATGKSNKLLIRKLPQGHQLTFQQKLRRPEGTSMIVFKVMRGKTLQPRILHLTWLSFRSDGNPKFHRLAKAKNVQCHQTSFTTNVRGNFLVEKKRPHS